MVDRCARRAEARPLGPLGGGVIDLEDGDFAYKRQTVGTAVVTGPEQDELHRPIIEGGMHHRVDQASTDDPGTASAGPAQVEDRRNGPPDPGSLAASATRRSEVGSREVAKGSEKRRPLLGAG